MARRRLADPPLSRLALWGRRLALFALATVALGTLIVRTDLLEFEPAIATVGGGLVLAGIATALALAALVPIWRDGAGGLGHALLALVIGTVLLAYPAYLGVLALRLPAINDIATDPDDPPQFDALALLRARLGGNPAAYPGQFAELQRAAYPDIEPLTLALAPAIAYEVVHDVVTRRRWRIIDARRPQRGGRDGQIEAISRTPIMGFRDDIVIRIRATREGSRIDVRSASRYGGHDLGTNAARIAALIEDIEAAADALPPARRAPEPAEEPKPAPQQRRAPARR